MFYTQPPYMRLSNPWMLVELTFINFQNLEPQILTTYAVSPRFVIKESMGTGVLDSNFIPKILKSFWEPRES